MSPGLAKSSRLQALQPTSIVLEATGGFERRVVRALAAAQLPIIVVNPRQVRDFAKATGQLAKTDTLDARVLTRFAEVVGPALRPLPDAALEEVRARVARRRQLIDMLTAEKNRLERAALPVQDCIQEHIIWLTAARKRVDADLDESIQRSPPDLADTERPAAECARGGAGDEPDPPGRTARVGHPIP